MNKPTLPSIAPLLGCIAAFFEVVYALGMLIVTLLIAVPVLGLIVYFGCALFFPADWALSITAVILMMLLIFTALSARYDS